MPVAEALVKEMDRSAALEQHGIAGLREVVLAVPEPDVKQQAAVMRRSLTPSFTSCEPGTTAPGSLESA